MHRLLVDHLLATRGATPLPGMREAVVQMMSQGGIVGADQRVRALLAAPDRFDGAQRQAIEDALVRLVAGHGSRQRRRCARLN